MINHGTLTSLFIFFPVRFELLDHMHFIEIIEKSHNDYKTLTEPETLCQGIAEKMGSGGKVNILLKS